jgi:hypothetical protein
LERVVLHYVSERSRVGARPDRLTRLERAVRQLGCIRRRRDLLLRDRIPHGAAPVDAHVDRSDAEGDKNDPCRNTTELQDPSHLVPSSR